MSASSPALTMAAELGNLEAMQAHLAQAGTAFGLAPQRLGMLALAFEEIFVNICQHAYPAGPGPVTLVCHDEGTCFVVDVIDEGRAFDPDRLGEPDLAADIDTRPVGGLGWFLVRRIADQLDCLRQDGRNIVRLTLYRQPHPSSS